MPLRRFQLRADLRSTEFRGLKREEDRREERRGKRTGEEGKRERDSESFKGSRNTARCPDSLSGIESMLVCHLYIFFSLFSLIIFFKFSTVSYFFLGNLLFCVDRD